MRVMRSGKINGFCVASKADRLYLLTKDDGSKQMQTAAGVESGSGTGKDRTGDGEKWLLASDSSHRPEWKHMATTALDTAEGVWLKMKEVDWNLLSSYAGLLGLATVSIYAGAFGSLPVSVWAYK